MQTQTISDPLPKLVEIIRLGIEIGEIQEDLEVFDNKCARYKGHKLEEYIQEVFDRV